MQFHGKLMHQTEENGKKLNSMPDFGYFGPNFGPKIFFVNFTCTRCYTLLQAITVCNFKELMIYTQENGEKPNFWPNLGPLGPNSGRQFFFFFSKIWLRWLAIITYNIRKN